ncbi:MAG: restriction endonuclease subunit S [Planctomycetota bacterium]
MSELPEGWEECSFGDVIRNVSINDKKLPRKHYSKDGRFPVIDQGQQLVGGYSDDLERVVEDNLPLLVFGDHTRIFKFLNRPFVPGADGVKVFKPIGVDEKWLYHIAHALDFPDKGYARHFQYLKKARLLIPPLPEQRRIVARIEELFSRLDAGVAALRHAKAQLKRYRQSVLAAAVTGQLTQVWREEHPDTEPAEELLERILVERRENWSGRGKYKEPKGPKLKQPMDVPEGWQISSVDQICKNFDGQRIPLKRADRDQRSGEFPYYGASGIIDDIDDYLFDGDFLLIAEDGANLLSRSTPIAFQAHGRFWVNNHAHIVQTLGGIPLTYVGLFFNGKDITRFVTGTAQPKLTQANLNQIPIPLPPLAEQHQIVAEVEGRTTAIDHLEVELDRQITRSNRLRQSTLAAAFTGNLLNAEAKQL